jgi:putative transposase
MSFRLIEAEKAQHPVSRLCTVLGVTRAGYYAWRRRGPSRRRLGDARLERLIVTIYDGSLQTYGAPRIEAELRDGHAVHVGRKRVARLMKRLGIEGVSRRGKRKRTTIADPKAPPAPDLVERRFEAERPNALWLADITYIPTHQGWLFLAAVVDCFSRRVVGWSMRDDLKADLVVDALSMAVARRKPTAALIHHSDRGSQYTSLAFGRTLRESGLLQSMGSRGDAYDNALVESFISTIKCELIKRRTWKTRDQARLAVFQYIETFYNPRRRHSALGYRSPTNYELEYERMTKEEPTHTLEATIAA